MRVCLVREVGVGMVEREGGCEGVPGEGGRVVRVCLVREVGVGMV